MVFDQFLPVCHIIFKFGGHYRLSIVILLYCHGSYFDLLHPVPPVKVGTEVIRTIVATRKMIIEKFLGKPHQPAAQVMLADHLEIVSEVVGNRSHTSRHIQTLRRFSGGSGGWS